MMAVDCVSGIISDLPARLRAATAAAHVALEETLALLAPPLEKPRFAAILRGFWGFHAIWEDELRRHAPLAAIMERRFRLRLIEADLRALGDVPEAITALPVCAAARGLCAPFERGLGSIYVMEGSSLGGQMITRALASVAWAPPGGLKTFNPYGAETGVMWRAFRTVLETAPAGPEVEAAVIAGANATFTLLRRWLGGGDRVDRR